VKKEIAQEDKVTPVSQKKKIKDKRSPKRERKVQGKKL